jgi:glycosyltransferase involved in cell wall biosynthesis
MQVKKIFIIVPSAKFESPVQGAIALANELVKYYPIIFVTIKKCKSNLNSLDKDIKCIELHERGGFLKRLQFLRSTMNDNGGKSSVASISIGFSADFFNSLSNNYALTISSVRGNLPKVYKNNYGWIGKYISYFHLKRLKKMDYVVSMTKSMSKMVESYISKKSPIIGNFVDETSMELYRRKIDNKSEYRFIYIGSLIYGKQPELLLLAMKEILKQGIKARLDVYGDGPLIKELLNLNSQLNLTKNIFFHGHVLNPFNEIMKADAMVLPSLSEGVSRAALEALYLGVPCIMRDIDGNSELITSGINGELFLNNADLSKAMLKTVLYSRSKKMFRSILIPDDFRQVFASEKYINIIDNHN